MISRKKDKVKASAATRDAGTMEAPETTRSHGLKNPLLMVTALLLKRLCSKSLVSCIAMALSLFAPGPVHAESATQIFVLHSYSQEYPWTQGQHEGFMKALAEDGQVQAAVSTEYLDTKRRTYDAAYASELARHLRTKYEGYTPSAIYVTDDNALLFARDHLSRVFPGAPVFFSGVNNYEVQNSLDASRFTGVFERKEIAPNLEWLLRVDKDANDLLFIGDDSNTYRAIEQGAQKDLIPYRLRATFIAEKRLDHALARLQDLPGRYLFLTTLGGMTDADGRVLPLHDIIKRLALTGRIVISMEDAYIIEGVLGGCVTSGREQGMNAARLLLAHQHGQPIVDLPPMLKSPNALIFDDRVLQQLSLNLPESLRAQAVLLNPRSGFYERHRMLILGSLIGLAVLLFWVVTGALVILTRKNRELALARNSAEAVNTLFNQLAEQSRTVHWEINAEGLYTHVSSVSDAVLGYRPEDLVGKKHFYDLFPEEARDANKTSAFEFFAQKEPLHDLEHTMRTRDGRVIWILTNGVPVLDDHGAFRGYRGSDNDITERKRAEETLRFLSSRLLTTQEEEQRRIAMELHDQTSQDLIVLKLHLGALKNQLRKDQGPLKKECNKILTFTNGIIEDVRRLFYGLSPNQLEALGLCSALTALFRNFSEKTRIPIRYDVEALDKGLRTETQIILYRIFQEALTNTYKHARAKTVQIDVSCQGDTLSIKIKDDGRGFDPAGYRISEPTIERGIGLSALELRARMIGADLKIFSQPGQGTEINLFVPLKGNGVE